MSFFSSYARCFANYANFRGRARRREYWGFFLINLIISSILGVVTGFINAASGYTLEAITAIPTLYAFVAALPGTAATVRRLHDTGRSGWSYLWCLTIVGCIPVLIWLCKEGDLDHNEYDKNPKQDPPATDFKNSYLVMAMLALAIGVAVFHYSPTPTHASALDKALYEMAKEANKELPVVISPELRKDKVKALPGEKFAYYYSFMNNAANEISIDMSTAKSNLVNVMKITPEMKFFMDKKVTIIYVYMDKDGKEIASIEVAYDDYK